MFFDSHAHYDDEQFDADRYETIDRVHGEGVGGIINAASDEASSRISLELSARFDYIYASVGVHPQNVGNNDCGLMDRLWKLASDERCVPDKKVVAIGEIGLDYKYDTPSRDTQKHWFNLQIELAAGLGLPIIIHNRDAHQDITGILKSTVSHVTGVLHHFTGSAEMASELLKRGFYISVAGPVTFKNARRIIDVVKSVPLERMLIETDCPYLAPEPHRGRRNDSGLIRHVAEKIAEIKSVPVEAVAEITTRNTMELFGVKQ